MEATFDFERLGHANRLVHKWIGKLNIPRPQIYNFVHNCKVGNLDYNLTEEEAIDLLQDIDSFSYIWEIENDLIKNYEPMIYFVAKKQKIQITDDIISKGFMAIRKSMYYYQALGSSFKSFCYQGIVTAFKQVFDSITLVDKKTKNATDMSKNDRNFTFDCATSNEDVINEKLKDLVEAIDKAVVKGILSDLEKNVLMIRIVGCNEIEDDWVNKFIIENNLSCSTSHVYKIFRNAAGKVRNYVLSQ
jgi:hypothetical protein